jgi:hypothetical protein
MFLMFLILLLMFLMLVLILILMLMLILILILILMSVFLFFFLYCFFVIDNMWIWGYKGYAHNHDLVEIRNSPSTLAIWHDFYTESTYIARMFIFIIFILFYFTSFHFFSFYYHLLLLQFYSSSIAYLVSSDWFVIPSDAPFLLNGVNPAKDPLTVSIQAPQFFYLYVINNIIYFMKYIDKIIMIIILY